MNVKKYYVKDMQQAMDTVRKELGPEAVILSSKPVRNKGLSGFFQKKVLEVVVAYGPADVRGTAKQRDLPQGLPENVRQTDMNLEKIDQLGSKISALQDVVADFTQKIKTVDKETTLKFSPDILRLYEKLQDSDVDEEIAKDLASETQDIAGRVADSPREVIRQLVIDRLGQPQPIRLKKFKRNIIMLVGPTGVGKTTTLVKLAGLFTCEFGLKVGLINTDTYRIGAHDQIRTYSDIMDIPLNIVYSPEELESALKTQEDRDVVLIDTVGKSSWDQEYRENLKSMIQAGNPDEVLLTVSVSTSHRAVKEIVGNYSFLENFKIIITKLDEVKVWGNALNIINYVGKPLAYVTVGQSVPDDIEQASAEKIADNIISKGIYDGSGTKSA